LTDRPWTEGDSQQIVEGPRVGLATLDASDPEGTFRPIEPYRPPPVRVGAGAALWPLRVLGVWLVNLAALALAGLVLTNVGSGDPFPYVAWSATFGLVNMGAHVAARLAATPRVAIGVAAALLPVNVLTVWLMTVVSPPSHAFDATALVKVGAIMWLANLALSLLIPRRRPSPISPLGTP
jgi:hypothetical protein